jgi:hypothetical protein
MSETPYPTVSSPMHHHRSVHYTNPEFHQSMSSHLEHPNSPVEGRRQGHPLPNYGIPPPYGPYSYPTYGQPYSSSAAPFYNYPHSHPPPPLHYSNGGQFVPPPTQGPTNYYPYGFPTQHSNKPPSESKPRKSPSRQNEKGVSSPVASQLVDDIELERLRAAEEPIHVKPMRSDFHFFVDDMRESIKEIVENELGKESTNIFLLFTRMNARLMKAWEDASDETKAKYFLKEEEDRRRFMADDDIMSRHCATLTARVRSPRDKDGEEEDDEYDEDDQGNDSATKRSPQSSVESPPKKFKFEDEHEGVRIIDL